MDRFKTGLLMAFLLLFPFPINRVSADTSCFVDLENFDTTLTQPICTLQEEGIIHGFPDGSFKPNWYVTKGEFLKLLAVPVLESKLGEKEDGLNLEDIDEIARLAVESELIQLELEYFDAEARITRRDAVEYLISVYEIDYQEKGLLGHPFADLDEVNDFDQKVAFLYFEGVVKGRTENTFEPDSNITRAEAAKLAYTAKELLSTVEPDSVPVVNEPAEEEEEETVRVAPYQLEIIEIAPRDVMAGETFTIVFTVTTTRKGTPVTGLDNQEIHASVVRGRASIEELTELGNGAYMLTAKVSEQAAAGPLKVDIVLLRGGSVRTSTSDFFVQEEAAETNSLVQVIPNELSTGDTATIIATPQDFRGNPVSGLTLEAVVLGSGRIISQMTEAPTGSGVYIGTYLAAGISGEDTIVVRITNTATRPESRVSVTVH